MAVDSEKVKRFLEEYAVALNEFDLPSSDFPLRPQVGMASGHTLIMTRDNRLVAVVDVEGDATCPAMPLGPATHQYAKLFVELANAWSEFVQRRTSHGEEVDR